MIRNSIKKLLELGPMPDESDNNITEDKVNQYSVLIDNISKPITLEEANILIKLFPKNALYGVEWSLLHLIESIYGNISLLEYKKLIDGCNSSEYKDILLKRLNNKNGNIPN